VDVHPVYPLATPTEVALRGARASSTPPGYAYRSRPYLQANVGIFRDSPTLRGAGLFPQ